MNLYPLLDLLRVREFREDKANQAVLAANRRVEQAEHTLETRRKALEEYRCWRAEEENRLLATIMKQVVKMGDIMDVRSEIATLREKEMDFAEAVQKAEAELGKARDALEEAKKAHKIAMQDLIKLQEHEVIWQQEQALELERAADAELEEFPYRAPFSPSTLSGSSSSLNN